MYMYLMFGAVALLGSTVLFAFDGNNHSHDHDDDDDSGGTETTDETFEVNSDGVIIGTEDDDTVNFTQGGNVTGDDRVTPNALETLGGDDMVYTAGPENTPAGTPPTPKIVNLGAGNDTLDATEEIEGLTVVNAGSGDDMLIYPVANATDAPTFNGGAGEDFFKSASTTETGVLNINLNGESGNDIFDVRGIGSDFAAYSINVDAGQGNDTIESLTEFWVDDAGDALAQAITTGSGDDVITINMNTEQKDGEEFFAQGATLLDFESGSDELRINLDYLGTLGNTLRLTGAHIEYAADYFEDDDETGKVFVMDHLDNEGETRTFYMRILGDGITPSDITFTNGSEPTIVDNTDDGGSTETEDGTFLVNSSGAIIGTEGNDSVDFTEGGNVKGDNIVTPELLETLGGDDIVYTAAAEVTPQDTPYTPKVINLGAGNDTLDATEETDGPTVVNAGSGDDLLIYPVMNATDAPTFNGGAGADHFRSTSDTETGPLNLKLNGGSGDDFLDLRGTGDLGAGYVIVADGGQGNDTIESLTEFWVNDPRDFEPQWITTGSGDDTVIISMETEREDGEEFFAQGATLYDFESGSDKLQINLDYLSSDLTLTGAHLESAADYFENDVAQGQVLVMDHLDSEGEVQTFYMRIIGDEIAPSDISYINGTGPDIVDNSMSAAITGTPAVA